LNPSETQRLKDIIKIQRIKTEGKKSQRIRRIMGDEGSKTETGK
jgi:hypothetical protein